MSVTPLVSIIIPAYNAEPWIGEALASCIGQTWKNIEIIVVDDGSTDATPGIVEAIEDSRLQLFQQKNAGAAAARNRGIQEALGELIQFLDADDILSPDKLERQVEALSEEPAGAVASCAWGRFAGTPESAVFTAEPVWTVAEPLEWLVASLGGGGMMQPAAWLTPREVADVAGPWDETLSLHDDGEYFARVMLHASRNVFVPEARVYYRVVADSLSRRRGKRAIESALAVCRARHRHLLAARDDREVRRALATQYAQFAYEFADEAPDLSREALREIRQLGVPPKASVGGRPFRIISAALGFETALRLRAHA